MKILEIIKEAAFGLPSQFRLDGKEATPFSTTNSFGPNVKAPLAGKLSYNFNQQPAVHKGLTDTTSLGDWAANKIWGEDRTNSFQPKYQPTEQLHQRLVNQGVTQGTGLMGNVANVAKANPGVAATIADNVIPQTQWSQDYPLLSKALADSGIVHNKDISNVVNFDPQGNPVVNTDKALDYAKNHTGDLMGNVANAAKGAWGSLSPDWQTGLKWGGGGLLGALALSSILGSRKQQQQPININVGGGAPSYHGYQSFEKSSGLTETLLGMAIGNGMNPSNSASTGKPIDTAAKEYHPNFSTTDPQVWKALQTVTAKKKLEDLILQSQNGVI